MSSQRLCEYVGCKKPAILEIKQLVGKKQTLAACKDCAPQWAKDGKPSKFYEVKNIENNVDGFE